jgi:hypothetical protein
MKGPAFLFLVVGALTHTYAQAPVRKMPMTINRPSVNVSAPFISMDGNTLLFISDYAEDNVPTLFYTQRQGADWTDPKPLPKHINTKLNYIRGTTLSADGKTLYVSTIRSGGVGGYDIWSGSLTGNSWGDMQNAGAPINSKQHEASPTFTPDGSTMYFMRCEKMTDQRAEGCKIMVSKKAPNGRWEEPVELPATINQGNSQTPRISADGEILIFASDAIAPRKGGMDLYVSRLVNGEWTSPVALDFVNTDKDDQFVSLIANGRYLMKDAPGKSTREILEFLMPEEWRPKSVMRIEGQITGPTGSPTPAYISVTDLSNHKRVFSGRPDAKGNYFLYLVQGSRYELAIDPEEGNYTYYSKLFDLTPVTNPLVQRANATLKPVGVGDELELEGIQFKPYSAELDDADFEIRRLARIIRSAPDFNYELQVHLAGLEQDTVRTSPDLTEVRIDSVIVYMDSVDSLGQAFSYDMMVTKQTFHNDRTEKQAKAIIDQVTGLGINPDALTYTVQARPEAIVEDRRTSVRMVVRQKDQH